MIARSLCRVGCLILLFACRPLTAEEQAPRQLPRIRTYDTLHIKAELKLDVDREEVRGTVTHTLRPMHEGFKQLELDCERLEVERVTVGGVKQKFELEEPKLKVTLDRVYGRDDELNVAVTYRGHPTRGLYFVKPDEFYPDKPLSIWTQGEPEQNHFWLPCYDYPNDLTTTEMIVTVPQELYVLSNGELLETRHDEAARTKTYHWKMPQPHVTYLISLVVGELTPFETEVDGLKIISYAPKNDFNRKRMERAYGRTGEMMQFFNKLIGVPYPWSKYAQVTVPEFRAGGMENISATTLTEFTLRDDAAALESTADGLIAHELAHQWWGNLLTCQDWSHLWLNESFATYFDALFTEYDLGPAAFAYKMEANQRRGIDVDKDKPRPIVWDRYKRPFEMFDARAYPKGASVLHMLRGLLGDDKFFAGLRTYCQRYRHQAVETANLQAVLEETSGRDLEWFFEQWVYQAGAPKLDVKWEWSEADSTARLSVKQTQKTSDLVPIFRLPTEVAFRFQDETIRYPLVIDQPQQQAIFRLKEKPICVRIDPDRWLLADIDFDKSTDELLDQLQHDPHPLGRAAAARGLAKVKDDDRVIPALVAGWKREKSEYLRRDMVKALGAQTGDTARDALLTALDDQHALVRREAVERLASFEGDKVLEALRTRWQQEPAPDARSAALRMLAKKKVDDLNALVEAALEVPSYRSKVGGTALDLLAASEHPRKRELILLRTRRGTEAQLRSAAVKALAKLVKEDDGLRHELRALVADETFFIRQSALSSLGEVGNAEDIALLESHLQQPQDKREAEMARESIKKIRKRLEKETPAAAHPKAKSLEEEANELEAKVKRLRNEAKQLRAGAKAPAAEEGE